ncbi:hypothetical protein [Noviherbaspirillum sp. Root189]|uniref:hypothetical protein n=1 Tax=Noviherbaspirillum sp. Root189 TaxID=1736487 RepID=UPI000708A855|nr:hypothetical protein [Noviherbaspirillum sp. Root189]KRB93509.1 hypothetical protein ASE07_12455 [Noviherbaspirillum sp. Root189]
MALLGKAALAMWWDMATDKRMEFEDWHSHEHFAERLAIPGFHRASRWRSADGGDGIFVMYELDEYEILTSPQYMAHLNAPTPWSRAMMPHHRNMVRGQCRVLESRGGSIGSHAVTLRFSPSAGRSETVLASLGTLLEQLAVRPGLVGAHLLQHQTPGVPPTEEQKIRGLADKAVHWVMVVCGYDSDCLQRIFEKELGETALEAMGVSGDVIKGQYVLAHSATPRDTT